MTPHITYIAPTTTATAQAPATTFQAPTTVATAQAATTMVDQSVIIVKEVQVTFQNNVATKKYLATTVKNEITITVNLPIKSTTTIIIVVTHTKDREMLILITTGTGTIAKESVPMKNVVASHQNMATTTLVP